MAAPTPDLTPVAEKLARHSVRATDGSGCLIWTGGGGRYGQVRNCGKTVSVHRASLELKLGRPLRPGMLACHIPTCTRTRCFEPDHLYEGTYRQNTQDAVGTDRIAFGERHGKAKLTSEQVIAIRRDRRPIQEIADDYGIYVNHVYKIRSRYVWRRLHDPAASSLIGRHCSTGAGHA